MYREKRGNYPGDGSGMYPRVQRIPKKRKQITCRLPQDLIAYAEREAYLRSAQPPYVHTTLSDVIRIALIHLRDTAAAAVPPDRSPCSHVEVAGMVFCSACGLQWTKEDEANRPACPKKVEP